MAKKERESCPGKKFINPSIQAIIKNANHLLIYLKPLTKLWACKEHLPSQDLLKEANVQNIYIFVKIHTLLTGSLCFKTVND